MKTLNLSNNNLTDDALMFVSRGLASKDNDLEELDLSRNNIADAGATALSKFLEISDTLTILNLSWNKIGVKGGIPLFFGIYKGRSLRNVNMAYNILGRGNSIEMIQMIVEAINDEMLKHLDLSYNNFSVFIWKKFGELLVDNYSLYGLHLQGNDCFVDGIGFIHYEDYEKWLDYSKNSILNLSSPDGFTTVK